MIALAVTGVQITFWVCAVLALAGGIGVVASRRPVYSALCLALVMVSLAAIYASLEAEFLFAVQIVVYTGAILMLFLFVIMLFGVQTRDSLTETIKGHRVAVGVAGVAFLALLVLATGQAITSPPVGLAEATGGGYMEALSQLIFQRYVVAFEATAGLLITAAVAAMVLAHPKRLRPKPGQAAQLRARLAAYASRGQHLGPLPNSGVTARHNSIATPALLPDGSVAAASISPVIAGRVAIATAGELTAPVNLTRAAITGPPLPRAAQVADEPSPLSELQAAAADAVVGQLDTAEPGQPDPVAAPDLAVPDVADPDAADPPPPVSSDNSAEGDAQ